MFDAVKDWFEGLEPRERWMVSVCAVLVGLSGLYLLVVEPYLAYRSDLTSQVSEKRETVAWMKDTAAEIRSLEAAGRETSAGSGESLFGIVDRTAKDSGLGSALRQITPDGDNAVRVRMDAARFDRTLRWLAELERSHGVSVARVTFDRTDQSGRVNISLTLEREVA